MEAIEKLIGAPIPRIQVEGFDPVEFAPDDGKRRRGRGRLAKPATPRAAATRAETAEAPEPADPVAAAIPKPRRSRARKPAPVPVELDAPQPEIVVAEPAPVPRAPREENHRREPRAQARTEDVRPRRDDARAHYRERGRRDDDLGPAVLGFGDDVPAFMMLRSRGKAAEAAAEAE